MKRFNLVAVLVGLMAIVAFGNRASAMYNPGLGRFLQRDPGPGGVMSPTRVGQYRDGMNLHQYASSSPSNVLDPNGTVIIVIHGVESDGQWTSDLEEGMKMAWKENRATQQDVLRFTWGPDGKNPSWTEASDAVKGMGKEAQRARDRLKPLTDELRKLFNKFGCKDEPINVIAHSQGTIITLAALAAGAKVDNLVALGSPLDAEHGVIDVVNAGPNVGHIYNYWSTFDGWATIKGGGTPWTQFYSRKNLTWTLPENVTQINLSAEVNKHTAFQTVSLAYKYYGANTQTGANCCDRSNPNFKREYDDILKKYLRRP